MSAHLTPTDLPEVDTFSPGFTADPAGSYSDVLARSWAVRTGRGIEVLSYDACEAALLDPRFRSGAIRLMDFLGPDAISMLIGEGRTVLGSEGEDHRLLRGILSPWFTPRRISGLRDATAGLVARLLDEVEASGACEFVGDVARIVPGVVFCWMVGAPERDGVKLTTWSDTLLKCFHADPDDADDIMAANDQLKDYVGELIEAKRSVPGDDITSMLLTAEADGRISEADVRTLLHEMLSAATDNTMNSAATALWLLAEHPDQWDLLAADRSLLPSAIEECGRLESRVGSTPVLNTEAIEFRGLAIPADSISWLVFTAAHRDPAVFEEPARFDITRSGRRGQLSFGIGRHYCLGANLARMEIRVMLEAVLERWDRPHTAEGAIIDRSFGTAVHALPLTFTAVS